MKPTALRNVWIAVVAWTCLGLPASAGGLYSFIDDRGVIHFSDVPLDRRYQALAMKPRELAMGPLRTSEAPVQHAFDGLIARTARDFRCLYNGSPAGESCRLMISLGRIWGAGQRWLPVF